MTSPANISSPFVFDLHAKMQPPLAPSVGDAPHAPSASASANEVPDPHANLQRAASIVGAVGGPLTDVSADVSGNGSTTRSTTTFGGGTGASSSQRTATTSRYYLPQFQMQNSAVDNTALSWTELSGGITDHSTGQLASAPARPSLISQGSLILSSQQLDADELSSTALPRTTSQEIGSGPPPLFPSVSGFLLPGTGQVVQHPGGALAASSSNIPQALGPSNAGIGSSSSVHASPALLAASLTVRIKNIPTHEVLRRGGSPLQRPGVVAKLVTTAGCEFAAASIKENTKGPEFFVTFASDRDALKFKAFYEDDNLVWICGDGQLYIAPLTDRDRVNAVLARARQVSGHASGGVYTPGRATANKDGCVSVEFARQETRKMVTPGTSPSAVISPSSSMMALPHPHVTSSGTPVGPPAISGAQPQQHHHQQQQQHYQVFATRSGHVLSPVGGWDPMVMAPAMGGGSSAAGHYVTLTQQSTPSSVGGHHHPTPTGPSTMPQQLHQQGGGNLSMMNAAPPPGATAAASAGGGWQTIGVPTTLPMFPPSSAAAAGAGGVYALSSTGNFHPSAVSSTFTSGGGVAPQVMYLAHPSLAGGFSVPTPGSGGYAPTGLPMAQNLTYAALPPNHPPQPQPPQQPVGAGGGTMLQYWPAPPPMSASPAHHPHPHPSSSTTTAPLTSHHHQGQLPSQPLQFQQPPTHHPAYHAVMPPSTFLSSAGAPPTGQATGGYSAGLPFGGPGGVAFAMAPPTAPPSAASGSNPTGAPAAAFRHDAPHGYGGY